MKLIPWQYPTDGTAAATAKSTRLRAMRPSCTHLYILNLQAERASHYHSFERVPLGKGAVKVLFDGIVDGGWD